MDHFSLEDAGRIILDHIRPMETTEALHLEDSIDGRILAEDLCAVWDNPPFDRSPLDGYAVIAQDTQAASRENPVKLRVIDEISAGEKSHVTVHAGEAVRIMTGAPVPAGADTIIRQEDTDSGEKEVLIYRKKKKHEDYCFAGEDYQKGALLLKKNSRLTFIEIGITAGMGYDQVRVYQKPRIALLTTGDEVIMPGETLGDGKIYNSNLFFLKHRLREFGYEPCIAKTVKDDTDLMAAELKTAAADADLIITAGGASVGKKDILHTALAQIRAARIFWGVDLKPGAPTIFSIYEQTPIISLTGNPFGAIANMELLVRPALQKLSHDDSLQLKYRTGVMTSSFPKASKGRRFIRAVYDQGNVSLPEGLHASGAIATLLGCNCMVDIPPGTPALNPGDRVQVILLD